MNNIKELTEHIIACADLWDKSGVSRVRAITKAAEDICQLENARGIKAILAGDERERELVKRVIEHERELVNRVMRAVNKYGWATVDQYLKETTGS